MAEQFLDDAQALTCIHCGLCLAACPTYLETGNENDSPRGRIYLMRGLQNSRLPLAAPVVRHLDLCLGCRACEAACPSGVPYGALLESTREHVTQRYSRSLFQTLLRQVAVAQVFPFPWRMRLAAAVGRWLPRTLHPALELLPATGRRVVLPEFSAATAPCRGRVGLITGCVQSVLFGETNAATVRLLNRAGYDVVIPRMQGCCGALDAHNGNLARAREFAQRNLDIFTALALDAVMINAAGCGSTLKEYGHLLGTDSARRFSAQVKDLSEILPPPQPTAGRATRVTFHDACHLAHAQRIKTQPRALVRAVAGENFVELPEADVCCGSAGSYNLTEPAMAGRLQQRKIANILTTGAAVVVTTNPGCILQLRAGLRQAGAGHVRVLHLADFLDEAAGQ